MKRQHPSRHTWFTTLLLAANLVFVSTHARAQIVSDGATNVINGVSTNIPGSLTIGTNGANTLLVITNGGQVADSFATIGRNNSSLNNQVIVTGPGSLWTNDSDLTIGAFGSGSQLLIANGGKVANSYGYIGIQGASTNNQVTVTGAGSLWTNSGALFVGTSGKGNTLIISNGGRVASDQSYIGSGLAASNNQVTVTGTNSVWITQGDLQLGVFGSGNTLQISQSGAVLASNVIVGLEANSSRNLLSLIDGTLTVTNATGNGTLDVRHGNAEFNGGIITADALVLTNGTESQFTFNAGTLNVGNATIANGAPFTVGGGTSNAVYLLTGSGTHSFGNNLIIASNASLTGNGVITGSVTNLGFIAPGNSAGSLRINGSLSLGASAGMSFEIGGLIATNQYDQVTVTNFVEFAGTLSLTLLNGFLPASTNSFTLMTFASSAGFFANVTNNTVLQTTDGLRKFTVLYTGTSLVLTNAQPVTSNTAFKLTSIIPGNNQATVRFESTPTNFYEIQYSSTLTNWIVATNASSNFTPFASNITQWIDGGTNTGGLPLPAARFYRVRQLP